MVRKVLINGQYPGRITINGRDVESMFKDGRKVWRFPARTEYHYPYLNELPDGSIWDNDLNAYTKNNLRISEIGGFSLLKFISDFEYIGSFEDRLTISSRSGFGNKYREAHWNYKVHTYRVKTNKNNQILKFTITTQGKNYGRIHADWHNVDYYYIDPAKVDPDLTMDKWIKLQSDNEGWVYVASAINFSMRGVDSDDKNMVTNWVIAPYNAYDTDNIKIIPKPSDLSKFTPLDGNVVSKRVNKLSYNLFLHL